MLSRPEFREALEHALKEEMAFMLQNLANDAAEDWGDYKKRVGAIQAFQRVMDISEEVAKQLEQR